ncbi:MAG: hypothetical protein NC485_08515 [Ruminococcus flavefaciens]|nr:hypothetical protein [Ruminococcus flavefaciens]MCM1062743.1 hypothetical protein [Eubacterium sp.]
MNIKRLISVVVVFCLAIVGWAIYRNHNTKSEKTHQDDYRIIETLHREMDKISKSASVYDLGDNGVWHIYELGLMYEKDEDFFKQLSRDLGSDFKWKLSNSDSLFIGILPHRNNYRIYAGTPDDEHMLYPEWNYSKLEEK